MMVIPPSIIIPLIWCTIPYFVFCFLVSPFLFPKLVTPSFFLFIPFLFFPFALFCQQNEKTFLIYSFSFVTSFFVLLNPLSLNSLSFFAMFFCFSLCWTQICHSFLFERWNWHWIIKRFRKSQKQKTKKKVSRKLKKKKKKEIENKNHNSN